MIIHETEVWYSCVVSHDHKIACITLVGFSGLNVISCMYNFTVFIITEPENGLQEGEAQLQMGRIMPLLQVMTREINSPSHGSLKLTNQ